MSCSRRASGFKPAACSRSSRAALGKTRLSLQVAAETLHLFPDGVWVAELAPITDPSLVERTVASVFGLREQMGMPLHGLLLDYLRDKELLLVVDNCEHLVESCAQLIEQLLHACAKLKIIASSREFGIAGVLLSSALTLPEGSTIASAPSNGAQPSIAPPPPIGTSASTS
jgi:hypothetical protein